MTGRYHHCRRRRRRTSLLLIAALSLPVVTLADAPTDVETAAPKAATGAKPQGARPAPATAATKPKASTAPTTRPAKELSAEEMLSQMLKSPEKPGNRPLAPLPQPASGGPDKTSGAGAVPPAAPVVSVLREGTFLVDRIGRLTRSKDGSQAEFSFESDGTSLQDPPLVIIPNLKLQQMEDTVTTNTVRDVRFRVSGMLTEYRGRNYIMLEKVVVIPDILEKF